MNIVGGGSDDCSHLEIERVFLLRAMPEIPAGARELCIEQGYLPSSVARSDSLLGGRLRRTTRPDGMTVFHHTVKRGSGMIREEQEREISREEFEQHWPRTDLVRIVKTRYEVRVGDLVWQVDAFDRPPGLVLAEIELPSADARILIPEWVIRVLAREVTDESAYTNRALAMRLAGVADW